MNESGSCVEFLVSLIRTRSLPGEEGEIAHLVSDEMRRLGFDEVTRDDAGNVIGICRGRGEAPPLMLNCHLDHVDVGNPGRWPHPPYAGEIHQGKVWGRGAVDIKGPLAVQIHAVGSLLRSGRRPPGDVYMAAVVQEEIGGLGARFLVKRMRPALVIVGEPSRNELRRGHRGRVELVLHARGKSVHASIPEQGVNPLETMARFLLGLAELPMEFDPDLGKSSVAPTLLKTDQTSPNVTPGEVWLTCDWRTVPTEDAQGIQKRLQQLADRSATVGAEATVIVPSFDRVTYSGFRMRIPAEHPAFVLPPDHKAVRGARKILSSAIGLDAEPGIWRFATDGGHFAKAGIPVLGFGPGDDRLAHTIQESIEIGELEKGLAGYQAMISQSGLFL